MMKPISAVLSCCVIAFTALTGCQNTATPETETETEGQFDQELYDQYLSGKSFKDDNTYLVFSDQNTMTYNHNEFHYTYSVTQLTENDGNITATLILIDAGEDNDGVTEGTEESICYHIADNTIDYYVTTFTPYEMPETTDSAEAEPAISKDKAEKLAYDDAVSHGSRMMLKASGCSKIKYFEVASCEEGGSMIGVEYSFKVKGNFFGYDEYGTLKGHYKYEWCIGIEKDGTVRESSNPSIIR